MPDAHMARCILHIKLFKTVSQVHGYTTSPLFVITIGIVCVAFFEAMIPSEPPATMTSTCSLASSSASLGSSSFVPKRYSIVMFLLSS
jgi:hypothetical protein